MFLKFDMLQGLACHSDMRHDHFLNSTGDMGINKRQRHATLALVFLKSTGDMGTPRQGPHTLRKHQGQGFV